MTGLKFVFRLTFLQTQPAAAPQPSSTGFDDFLMVDTTPTKPAATGMMALPSKGFEKCKVLSYIIKLMSVYNVNIKINAFVFYI